MLKVMTEKGQESLIYKESISYREMTELWCLIQETAAATTLLLPHVKTHPAHSTHKKIDNNILLLAEKFALTSLFKFLSLQAFSSQCIALGWSPNFIWHWVQQK